MNRSFASLIISLFVLSACGGGESVDSGGSAVRGVSDTEIIIGSQNDLSGPAALLGKALVNAARLRFDQVNESGGINGRKIRFVVEDAQYQLPKAIQATNKLINRDNIFLMFLSMGTPMNNAIMQTLFDASIPNIFPISGGRQMVEPFRPLMFTARGIYYDEIRAGVRYFVEERGAKNICAIYQDTDYGIEIFEAARDQTTSMGMELTEVSSHRPTDTDFTAAILKLKNAGCDTIMMGTIYKDTILIFDAARKMGWDDVSFVGQNAAVSGAVATADNGVAEGYFAFVHIAPAYEGDDMTPEAAKFFSDYKERFGEAPDYPAIEGYRGADALVVALEKAGRDLTPASLVAAFESMSEYNDIFGYRLTFSPTDHKGVDKSTLVTVKDGRWVKLAESISY